MPRVLRYRWPRIGPPRKASEDSDDGTAPRRTRQAQRGSAPADRAGAVRGRRRSAGHGCTPRSSAATTPTRASAASTFGGAGARRAWSRSTRRRTWATTGSTGRCWCRRRRRRVSSSTSAPRCHWRGTRCATWASRWRWWWPRAATWPRMPPTDIVVDYEPLPAVVDLRSALAPGAPLVHEDVGSNLAAHVIQTKGDYAAARGAGRSGDPPPLPLRPGHRGADGGPRRGGAVGRAGPAPDRLGHDPGAHPHPQRPGRACWACRSARCGWWRRSSAAGSAPRS